ncbi:hypothetical protein [Burkholderia multivorans]|uniref:Uncharacterized protein n=1 Tax=Burkholderia multivorans (strain ATCC 17616 / 249) TaxID=395019 RepID=A0A0H3KBR6_BURM1|nr:hypothetical protein [Burkholderia multivorans]ABX16490.1 hypothetical protein Bmul_2806 [Burkholderia multivorans ATCC 17616]MBJ9616930.1 hypothetical protein [Burkholderia multivorans]PRF57656.1 hypothetical protein C6Q28_19180 [Burkholderia multivorans]PRG51760.1 hypothetical protein C6T63_16130 [Burkholderia multivorans]RSB73659.1 hypothetical protein EGT33_21330 [Burkholderia multivorans]
MSNTNQQTEIINISEHQSPASLAQTITALKTRYMGAHTALYEALRDIYAAYHVYILNATQAEREKNRAVLDQKCKDNDIGTNDQTTDLHKLVKLVVTVSPQLTSGYVHVFSVARELQKTPDEFPGWLKDAGGIETVRKKFLTDGKLNPNYESGSKREKNRLDKIASARNALQATCCTIGAPVFAGASLDPVDKPTECIAIAVRNPDGSIGIKGFISSKSLIDSAYLEHATEQNRKAMPAACAKSAATVGHNVGHTPAQSPAEDLATIADRLIAD